MKKLLRLSVLGLFSALTVGPALICQALTEEPTSSTALFATTLHDLDDLPVALTRYRGKPLVVNFWARWCAPCRAEIPELIKFRAANKGKIEVLGIGIEDSAPPAKEFARNYAIDYPVLIAKEQGIDLMLALGNSRGGLPYTLFIDGKGHIVHSKLGLLKPVDLEQGRTALLGK